MIRNFLAITFDTWSDVKNIASYLKNFAFRGQRESDWELTTTLERSWEENKRHLTLKDRSIIESRILDAFIRRAHHFVPNPPDSTASIEWISLLQHYGGPTRFLDFSWSFYIAIFFAVEKATRDAAVWAINIPRQRGALLEKIDGFVDIDSPYNAFADTRQNVFAQQVINSYRESDGNFVIAIDPVIMNDRQAAQQGLFLMQSSVQKSFEENLAGTFDFDPIQFRLEENIYKYDSSSHTEKLLLDTWVVKIVLPKSMHCEILNDLWKMNINAASLFPGLDGYARSMYYYPFSYVVEKRRRTKFP